MLEERGGAQGWEPAMRRPNSHPISSLAKCALVVLLGVGLTAPAASAARHFGPAPTIIVISPTVIAAGQPGEFKIHGANFHGDLLRVTIWDAANTMYILPNPRVDSPGTLITVAYPALTVPGNVQLEVISLDGRANVVQAALVRPDITSVSPPAGPLAGGTAVELRGVGLMNASPTWSCTHADGSAPLASFHAADGVSVVDATTIRIAHMPNASGVCPVDAFGGIDVTFGFDVTNLEGGHALLPTSAQFTYQAAPILTAISPLFAPASGGSTIQITGRHLERVDQVLIGGVPATGITPINDRSLTVTMPETSGGYQKISVHTPGGTAVNAAVKLGARPVITSLTPSMGPTAGGTRVALSGYGLSGLSAVTFAGQPGTNVTRVSNALARVTAPDGGAAGPVNLHLTFNGDGYTWLAMNKGNAVQFRYMDQPVISQLSPSTGPMSGGTQLTIRGTSLNGASRVLVRGLRATIVSTSFNTVVIETPESAAAGGAAIEVTAPGGRTSIAGGFTYLPNPTIASATPNVGPARGGTHVTITGTNLRGTQAVNFGGVAATSFTVVSGREIDAVTPPGDQYRQVQISVTTAAGRALLARGFAYGERIGRPDVLQVTPRVGLVAGGTEIVIEGRNFTGATIVNVNDAPLRNMRVVSATEIRGTTPPGTLGEAIITIAGPGGTVDQPGFAYVDYGPGRLTSVSPNVVPTTGGTLVVVRGEDFWQEPLLIQFGEYGVPVLAVSRSEDHRSLIIPTPAVRAPGVYPLRIRTFYGWTNAIDVTFQAVQPRIELLSESSGCTTCGTPLLILLADVVSPPVGVTFGGAGASFDAADPTALRVGAPYHAEGTVDVVVTFADGSHAVAPGAFTYTAPPAPAPDPGPSLSLTSVSPSDNLGSLDTTLTGAGLLAVDAVSGLSVISGTHVETFVTGYTIVNDTTITFTFPDKVGPGVYSIKVYAGTGSATLPGAYVVSII